MTIYYYSPQTRSVIKLFRDTSVDSGEGRKREFMLIKYGVKGTTKQDKITGKVETSS